MKFWTYFFAFLFSLSYAWADVQPIQSEDLRAAVKNRLYPGGVDEEDIKVQEELSDPVLYNSKRQVESAVRKKLLEKKEEASSSTQ